MSRGTNFELPRKMTKPKLLANLVGSLLVPNDMFKGMNCFKPQIAYERLLTSNLPSCCRRLASIGVLGGGPWWDWTYSLRRVEVGGFEGVVRGLLT